MCLTSATALGKLLITSACDFVLAGRKTTVVPEANVSHPIDDKSNVKFLLIRYEYNWGQT